MTAPDDRLAVSAEEAARLLDVSKSSFERIGLKGFKVGRLTRYRVTAIQRYIEQQEGGRE